MDHISYKGKNIRLIEINEIIQTTKELFINANHILTKDVIKAIKKASGNETSDTAKGVLCRLCDNLCAASELDIPICQDTGMAVAFVDIGEDVHIIGGTLEEGINEGVRQAYIEGKMRLSIVRDPLFDRINTNDNTPAVIHIRTVKGNEIKITATPKGFGSENMSSIKMFTPSATPEDIINYVVECVKKAGSNPCPPIVVGVGIGGNFEHCAYLSKRALARSLDDTNQLPEYAKLENEILERVNKLNIGPQGFGGKTTALAVKIETAPTHIAGLPVAVNINCHVARHLSKII